MVTVPQVLPELWPWPMLLVASLPFVAVTLVTVLAMVMVPHVLGSLLVPLPLPMPAAYPLPRAFTVPPVMTMLPHMLAERPLPMPAAFS